MQLTIDSSEPLERVLPVLVAFFGVELTVPADQPALPGPRAAIDARRPAGRSRKARTEVPAAPARRRTPARPDPVAVRAWARAKGLDVKDRGRVPAAVVDAYLLG